MVYRERTNKNYSRKWEIWSFFSNFQEISGNDATKWENRQKETENLVKHYMQNNTDKWKQNAK